MNDDRRELRLRVDGEGADRSRCVLCGGPNDCALATHAAGARGAGEACWCVARRFPEQLVREATGRDGGAACICRVCLDRASAEQGGRDAR